MKVAPNLFGVPCSLACLWHGLVADLYQKSDESLVSPLSGRQVMSTAAGIKASFLSPTRTQRQKRRRQRRLRSESHSSPPSFALARAGGQAATEVDNKGRKLRWGRGGGGGNASLSISAWKVVWPPSFPFLLPSPPAAASPTFALSLSYALGREKSLRSSGGEESLLLREGRKKTFAKFGTRTGEGGRRGVQSRGACSPRNQIQRILEKDIQ